MEEQLAVRVHKEAASPDTRMCVVSSKTNLGTAPIPGSLKELLLDTFDGLHSNAKTLLRCASVLGSRFSRSMLIRLIPQYDVHAKQFEREFRTLMENKLIRCASLPHANAQLAAQAQDETGKVYCYCRFSHDEILAINELVHGDRSKPTHIYNYYRCKFMQFTKDSMMEVIYEVMMDEQRKELHLRAAKYLDTSIIRCAVHGGGDTAFQFGFTLKGAEKGTDHEDALRQAAGSGKRRSSFYGAAAAVNLRKLSSGDESKGDESLPTPKEALDLHPHHRRKSKHEASKADLSRKLYGERQGKPHLDISISKEMTKFENLGKRKLGRCCRRRKKKKDERAAEYDLKIKNLEVANKDGDENESGKGDSEHTEVVDLRGCVCTNIQLKVCVEMVKHYRQAEKYGKCLLNLLDAGECAVSTGNSLQALAHLEDAVALVEAVKREELPAPKASDPDDIAIDDEEVNIQVEFLNGLSYFELGIHTKARDFFLKSLKHFGLDIPSQDDKVQIKAQTMRLNSKLWKRHHTLGCACCRTQIDDGVEVDPLVTLKLRILTYLQVLYKVERKYDMVLLVSLWQVLTAEEGSGLYQDVLPAYCTMMETYSFTSEHKKAEVYEKLAMKTLRGALNRAKDKELPPLGLYTAAAVFSTVSFINLLRGDIKHSNQSAYLSLRIAKSMHDNTIALQVYPRLVITLLMELRVSEVIEVLQRLWYIADEEEDFNGTSVYWTLCISLLLNTAYPLESYSSCEHFALTFDWGTDVHLFRMYEVQYNMESSIALWNARFSRWEIATKWIDKAGKSKPKHITYLSVEAQLKLLETELMFVNHYLENKKYQHFAKSKNTVKQMMTSLDTNTKKIPILQPRFLHLIAYYCKVRARHGEAEKQLNKAEALAFSQGNALEVEWIAHNRTVWAEQAIPTIKYFWLEHTESNNLDWHQSTKVPWSNIMFSLPLPV